MKKIAVLLTLSLLAFKGFSQDNKSFNKWSIGINVGGHDGQAPTKMRTKLYQIHHYGINGRYMFNNRFGLMLDLGYDLFDGNRSGEINTNYVRTSVQGVLNAGDLLRFPSFSNRLGLLVHGGAGMSQMFLKKEYRDNQTPNDRLFKGVDDMVNFIFGITPQVKLCERVALNADLSFMFHHNQTNRFDMRGPSRHSAIDGYFLNLSIGANFYLGKKATHADWTPTIFGDKYDDTELRQKIADAEKKVAEVEEKVKDDDNDGVPNYHDQEPNTPEGVKVDSDGIELKDSDGDGVRDDIDACPDKAGVKENLGCPEIPREDQALMQQAIEGVKFQTGKDILTNESHNILDFVALNMKNNPQYKLKIEGHTDNVDDDAYNMDLSNKRANAVKNYLVGRGVAADRMQTKGFGETMPIATNDTEEGRTRNRRVDFIIVFKFD